MTELIKSNEVKVHRDPTSPDEELLWLKRSVHQQRDQITVLNNRLFLLEERIAALERIAAPIVEEKAKEVLKDGIDSGSA